MTTATSNGTTPDIRAAARELIERGFALCKPDEGTKKPTYKNWPTRSLNPEEFAEGDLIGIMGGPLSDGNMAGHALVIIDLDAPKAVEEADTFLPPTNV